MIESHSDSYMLIYICSCALSGEGAVSLVVYILQQKKTSTASSLKRLDNSNPKFLKFKIIP